MSAVGPGAADPEAHEESGFSLIELVVAGAVTVVLGAVLASILIAGVTSNAATGDRDRATGSVQAISTSLSSDIRNAGFVSLTQNSTGTIVKARVATGRDGWECRAWAIVDLETWTGAGRTLGADGKLELRVRTYASGGTSGAPAASWGVLAHDVTPIISTATPAPAAPSYLPYFTLNGNRLTWNLGVASAENAQLSDGEAAALTGAAVARAFDEGNSGTCS